MVKHKYRESYSFQKYNSDIPIKIITHTAEEKNNIFAFIVYENKLFNFIREDNYSSNGWINLYCIEIDKTISCRYCDDSTMYIHSNCLIGRFNEKLFLNKA